MPSRTIATPCPLTAQSKARTVLTGDIRAGDWRLWERLGIVVS